MNTKDNNQDLTGALPAGLGDLGPALKILNLEGNAITSLPTELGTLTGLTSLRLQRNAITAVPTDIRALTGLTILYLQDNAITAVPSELGALTGLTYLDLADNRLTGVPAEFRTVNPPESCDLSNNPDFTCANVGAGTSCCIGAEDDYGDVGNNCGEGLPGGPCYAGG